MLKNIIMLPFKKNVALGIVLWLISKSAHACIQALNETTRIFSGETKVKFSMLNYPFSILNNPYADLYKIRYVLVYYEALNVTLPTVQCCPFGNTGCKIT